MEPSLSLDDFPWMPKQRYSIMKKYMPKVGTLGHHMMKRTCTNQVNLDYHSEEDMIAKYRLMLNLEGIATAIFANSPFDQKEVSKYKSLRSHFWHHTDKDRTGLLPFVFDKDFNFEKYAEYALDVPMYFVIRNHKYIDMTDYTFRDFMKNNISKDLNIEPTIEDWINHLSTLFPQVRLKQFLEIRSMDACSWDLICSQPAFWIGILYNDEAINKTNEIVEGWTQNDRNLINSLVPKEGLQTKFKNGILLDIAQKLFEISKSGLEKRGILKGDVIMIYSGWSDFYKDPDTTKIYYSTAPGISYDAAEFLASKEVVAVGLDTCCVDARPDPNNPDSFKQPEGTPQNQTFPVHDYFLTKVGIHTLENLNLKKLANESVYESCTMILPLKSKGSAGSPIRPVAIGRASKK